MIKKNETQLKYLYGEEVVETLKKGVLEAIHNGQAKVVSASILENDEKLEAFLNRNFSNKKSEK